LTSPLLLESKYISCKCSESSHWCTTVLRTLHSSLLVSRFIQPPRLTVPISVFLILPHNRLVDPCPSKPAPSLRIRPIPRPHRQPLLDPRRYLIQQKPILLHKPSAPTDQMSRRTLHQLKQLHPQTSRANSSIHTDRTTVSPSPTRALSRFPDTRCAIPRGR